MKTVWGAVLLLLLPLVSGHGFISEGCLVTEDTFKQMHHPEIQETDVLTPSLKDHNVPSRKVKGEVHAIVIDGLKPYFKEHPKLLEKIIENTHVKSHQGDTFTNSHGEFALKIGQEEETFSIIYESPSIKAINDRHPYENHTTIIYDPTIPYYRVLVKGSNEHELATINAYYQALQAEKWMTQKELITPPNITIRANFYPFCNAGFIPELNWVILGIKSNWTHNNQTVPCANTAYSTIVQHEYGHSFLNSIIGFPVPPSFQDPNAYHEAIADSFSALSLKTACMGEDLFGPDSGCTRNLTEKFVYPVKSNDVYNRSRPLSSALWELRTELVKKYGEQGDDIMHVLFVETVKTNKDGLHPNITQVMLQKDQEFFAGKNKDLIESTFRAYGLLM